ncbi:MAG TPA: histidine phosphatase family protein [Chloroflexota bacterium]|nr:histidine phosphatase family protein [Chloroflexota bacterium]
MAAPQQVFLVRHGETEWSRAGRHTGRTDVPLSDQGRRRAEAIGRWLGRRPLVVYTSPLSRARETCHLAGYAAAAQVEPDLREWDYGVYEGRTTEEIRHAQPDWSVWLSPIVDGESLDQLADRARKVLSRVLSAAPGDVALFAHGHILRVLAACWLGLPPIMGRSLALDTASISVLGYEREARVIRLWNLQPPP